jgi:hypothetical protein
MAPRQSRIPAEAATDRRLRPCARRVLMVLGVHTDRNGWCVRSLSKIAAELGYDVRSVRRAVRQLEDIGYVEVAARRGSAGSWLASGYRVKTPGMAVPPLAPESGGSGHGSPEGSDSQESGGSGLSGVRPVPLTASSNEAAAGRGRGRSRADAREAPEAAAAAAEGGESGLEEDSRERQRKMAAAVALHRRIAERLGHPGGYRDELGEVCAWLEAGYDPDRHVMAAVERAARRRNFQAPLMLRYFRELIAEAAERAPGIRRAAGATFAATNEALKSNEAAAEPEPEGPAEWLAMRGALRRAVGEDAFSSWFARLEWRGVAGRTLTLAAPTRFIAGEIAKRHGQALDAIASGLVAGVEAVRLVVEKRKGAGP